MPRGKPKEPSKRTWRRGRPTNPRLTQPDLPYTMKLPDGRTLYVEVPGRYVVTDRNGEVAFTPAGVRFLDQLRAIASPFKESPSPAYITALRESLGMTQTELGEQLGVAKLTVSRWERGQVRPRDKTLDTLKKLVAEAKRKGTLSAG